VRGKSFDDRRQSFNSPAIIDILPLYIAILHFQREKVLKGAIAATAAAVKAVKPAPGQQHFSNLVSPVNASANDASEQSTNPEAVPPNSSSFCQLDTAADADASAAGSSTVDAALESAIFSALDADSSTDIFFPDPKTAALNHLLSQLATSELKVQSTLLRMGCPELPGDGLYTSLLLQQLLATAGQAGLTAAAAVPPEECLLQLAAGVKQISCLLPRCVGAGDAAAANCCCVLVCL
jgi:hypothetical protein